jgi:hypothetical protein
MSYDNYDNYDSHCVWTMDAQYRYDQGCHVLFQPPPPPTVFPKSNHFNFD